MITIIRDFSVFALLGLEDLTKEEKDQMVEDMQIAIVAGALNRLENDPALPADVRAKVTKLIGIENQPEKITELLLTAFPQIKDYLEEEEYSLKKLMMIDQINSGLEDFKETVTEDSADDSGHENINVVIFRTFKSMIEDETTITSESEFEQTWVDYLKIIYSMEEQI